MHWVLPESWLCATPFQSWWSRERCFRSIGLRIPAKTNPALKWRPGSAPTRPSWPRSRYFLEDIAGKADRWLATISGQESAPRIAPGRRGSRGVCWVRRRCHWRTAQAAGAVVRRREPFDSLLSHWKAFLFFLIFVLEVFCGYAMCILQMCIDRANFPTDPTTDRGRGRNDTSREMERKVDVTSQQPQQPSLSLISSLRALD